MISSSLPFFWFFALVHGNNNLPRFDILIPQIPHLTISIHDEFLNLILKFVCRLFYVLLLKLQLLWNLLFHVVTFEVHSFQIQSFSWCDRQEKLVTEKGIPNEFRRVIVNKNENNPTNHFTNLVVDEALPVDVYLHKFFLLAINLRSK